MHPAYAFFFALGAHHAHAGAKAAVALRAGAAEPARVALEVFVVVVIVLFVVVVELSSVARSLASLEQEGGLGCRRMMLPFCISVTKDR